MEEFVRPYTQQSGKKIGEVTDRDDRKNKNNKREYERDCSDA